MRISSRDKTEKWRITLHDERKLLAENIAMARELGAKFDKDGNLTNCEEMEKQYK
jgi:hypothetical protein